MMIDQVSPEIVVDKGWLKDGLFQRAIQEGLTVEEATERFAEIPKPLIDAGTFLDKLTGLWRYEFGVPFEIDETLIWGSHMWVPVDHLYRAIDTAVARLSGQERATYYARLNDAQRHAVTLAEMIPGSKVGAEIPTRFEVSQLGAGNTSVDWVVDSPERRVMLDVKSRSKDFIEQISQEGRSEAMPEPEHDPAVLFRSLEGKFLAADPDQQLQGVWIATHIQQNERELSMAFAALDPNKVHFAILGDWEPDMYILVRRDVDRQYLLDLFNSTVSNRFTFTPHANA